MDTCIFCKIIKGEIPSTKIYEDEKFLAFLDIQPVVDGHLLLIPKEHVVWMQDASDELISEIFIVTKKLMKSVIKGLGCDYVTVSIVGKDVPHFHIHLIPRSLNDTLHGWETKKYESDTLKQEVANKIIQAL